VRVGGQREELPQAGALGVGELGVSLAHVVALLAGGPPLGGGRRGGGGGGARGRARRRRRGRLFLFLFLVRALAPILVGAVAEAHLLLLLLLGPVLLLPLGPVCLVAAQVDLGHRRRGALLSAALARRRQGRDCSRRRRVGVGGVHEPLHPVVLLVLRLQHRGPETRPLAQQLGHQHEAAAREVGRRAQRHLEHALGEGGGALGGGVRLEGLEEQRQEHGRLGGARQLGRGEHRVERAVEAVGERVAGGHELEEEEQRLGGHAEGAGVDEAEERVCGREQG
jgi:hypothetical protein